MGWRGLAAGVGRSGRDRRGGEREKEMPCICTSYEGETTGDAGYEQGPMRFELAAVRHVVQSMQIDETNTV